MKNYILTNISKLPVAASPQSVSVRMEQWHEQAEKLEPEIRDFALSFARSDEGKTLLESVFGNSPYLSQSLIMEIEFFKTICENGFDQCFLDLMRIIEKETQIIDSIENIMSYLRRKKRQISLLVALADITNSWQLENVTESLSSFAELCLKLSVCYLLNNAVKRGEIEVTDQSNPEKDSGLTVIAMGKLGSKELNYSSDIDIIVFFDNQKTKYIGRHSLTHFFIKLTQDLSQIMDERTRDGYVFRTDLRLRPDPGSTPAAISLQAAEIYYETLGQNWERAAMIKARPVAGDPETGERFMEFMIPYVWRRSLDFYSIQDIHSIKRQIDSRQGKLPTNLYGYNMKFGRGGIREIEFFAQTQQLIWGGRKPDLRTSGTCDSLRALVSSGQVEQKTCDELISAYRFYRTIEHRLQMIGDQQTHTLPDSHSKMQELAIFLGYKKASDFILELTSSITTVQGHYGLLFGSSPSLASVVPGGGSLVFTGSENDPETLKTLASMGFEETSKISKTIRGWHHGRYRATRTKRARELLTELMPSLLTDLSKTVSSDTAFAKFDEFLSKLPAGVQIFSLFYSNPPLLKLIAQIMGGYPYIADNLSRSPSLLDYVLAPEFYKELPEAETLHKDLKSLLKQQARDMQDVLDMTRIWAHDRQFRLGIQLIEKKTTPANVSLKLSNIADAILSTLLEYTQKEFEEQYGKIDSSNFAVVAMGKLGSRELTFSSDLDLVFIYDAPGNDNVSDGKTQLSASQYFLRLSRRFINSLTALTKEGTLYKVDLRLRPSGDAGPIASSLEAFDLYYGTSAWAWEYMALTRARVVVGTKKFRNKIEKTIRTKLSKKWEPRELANGIIDMHQRITQNFRSKNPFNIKYVPGGVIDLEYIAQFLLLKHAYDYPEIMDTNTVTAFNNLSEHKILKQKDAEFLMETVKFYYSLQSVIRLIGKEVPEEGNMIKGMKDALIQSTETEKFAKLRAKLVKTQKHVQKLFKRIILDSLNTEQ